MNHRIVVARAALAAAIGLGIVAGANAAPAAAPAAWLRVETTQGNLARVAGASGAAIDYGRFQWMPSAAADVDALRDAGITVTEFADPFVFDLGGERFDPHVSVPTPISTRGAGDAADWHLVQFNGPIKAAWLDALRADGVIPAQYVHPYGYVVWSDGAALARTAARNTVRWSGEFQTAFRVQPAQRGFDASLRSTMLLISRHRDQAQISSEIASLGALIESITPVDSNFSVVQLEAPGNRYIELASIAGIYAVQHSPATGGPRGEMSNQSIVGGYGAAPTYTVIPGYASWLDTLGYNGTGVIVSVVDGGIRTTHQDLASRIVPCTSAGGSPTSCSASNNSHGTHVAGAIAGTGASGVLLNGFLRGQGVAPGANLVQQRYNSFLGGGPGSMIANGMLTLYKESSLSNAVLTNNSWGPTGSPQGYDIPTQQIDIVIRDANPDIAGNQQVQNVWSIMNGNGDSGGACAPSSLGSPDEAKNLFAVGSTGMQSGAGAQVAQIFNVSSNSAHGNACDGRRVPNIVAPGCSTDSTSSGTDTAFGFSCGTSMASPVVTGAAAIFVEKFRAENGGATPSPAMIKAAFTAVATNLQGFNDANGRVMGHRPDRFQGYGRLDLDAVVNSPDDILYFDQADVLSSTGNSWIRTVIAADPARPVRIMLAWTDAKGPGLSGTTPAWVNNLDLSVSSDAMTYRGNVIGSNGWSASGGSADAINNLEGIFLSPAQIDGPIEISVLAANIAADALNPYVPGTPQQDFALVCYNCADAPLGSADLALSVGAAPAEIGPGGTLHFLATVVNFGADDASDVKVTLELPDELTFMSGRLVRGGGEWICDSTTERVVTCTLIGAPMPALSLASVLDIETAVSVDAVPGDVLITTATVSAAQFIDSNVGNNSAEVETLITDVLFADGFE